MINHSILRISIWALFPLILGFSVPQLASAQISKQEIKKLVLGSRVVANGTIISAHRIEGLVLVELKGPGLRPSAGYKSKAYLISSRILHEDPGYVRGVITRFYSEDGSSFSDVLVTSKDIVGVDAGIESRKAVLSRIPMTTIYFSESGQLRFNKYLAVAEKLRQNGDLYASKNYYSFARQQDESHAAQSNTYLNGLYNLGRAFDLRGDTSQVSLAYTEILNLATKNPNPSSMNVLRQVSIYFKEQGNYKEAVQACNLLLASHNNGVSQSKRDYIRDIRTLAFCDRKLGNIESAKKGLEKALSISQSVKVEDIPKVAILLEELGDCYMQEGNTSQAFDYYKRAKNKYDSSMANRQRHLRVDYAIYQGAVRRLRNKIRGLGKTS